MGKGREAQKNSLEMAIDSLNKKKKKKKGDSGMITGPVTQRVKRLGRQRLR